MKFFIVTPTYNGKQYCDTDWANSVNAQVGANVSYRHVVADTSEANGYATRLRTLLPNANVVRRGNLAGLEIEPLLLAVHGEARTEFLTGIGSDCDAYLSWESDIIAPTDALFRMQQVLNYGNDVAVFEYPDRENAHVNQGGLGFTGFKRVVLEQLTWNEGGGYGEIDSFRPGCHHGLEGWLFARAERAGFTRAIISNAIGLGHPNG